jgi:hypothetical protein
MVKRSRDEYVQCLNDEVLFWRDAYAKLLDSYLDLRER